MKYFEQVHRGIRALGRALAPAICAVALCTAALMLAAWPTMAEATGYQIWISNFPETGKSVRIRRIHFRFTGKNWIRFYDKKWDLSNNDSETMVWPQTYTTDGSGEHRFKVKWKCVGKNLWHDMWTNKTSHTVSHIKIKGCSISDVLQDDKEP